MNYNKNERKPAGATGKEAIGSQKNEVEKFDWRDVRISEETGNYIQLIHEINVITGKTIKTLEYIYGGTINDKLYNECCSAYDSAIEFVKNKLVESIRKNLFSKPIEEI
jgi:hypothetical protein